MKRWFLIQFFLAGLVLSAWGHVNSISYSKITVLDNEIHVQLRNTLLCTLELFAVDLDGNSILTKEELDPAKPAMFYYLNNKIKILSGGRQLPMALKEVTFRVEEDDSYTIFDLVFPTYKKPNDWMIFFNLSEEVDSYHRNLSEITIDDKKYLFVFNNTNYFDSRNPPPPEAKSGIPPSATATIKSVTGGK